MKDVEVPVSAQLQAMIALAVLPQKWEMLLLIVQGDVPLDDLSLVDVHAAVIAQYQLESIHYSSGKHNANKISVVTQTGKTSKGLTSSSIRTSSSKVRLTKPNTSIVNMAAKARPSKPISSSSTPTLQIWPHWPLLPPLPLCFLPHLGCRGALCPIPLLSSICLALIRPLMLQSILLKPLGLNQPSRQ